MDLKEITTELLKARETHSNMNSFHEGWAVIMEEVDELWELVRLKKEEIRTDAMRKECVQIAAMAVRFIEDLIGDEIPY